MSTDLIINYISFTSGLLPLIASAVNYKQLTYTLKLAAVFFLISFLVDLLSWLYYMQYIIMHNSEPFLHISIIASIVFYGIIYYHSFYSSQLKNITLITSIVVLSTVLFNTLKNSIWLYPSLGNTVLSLLMITLSLLYFYQLLNLKEFVHIESQPLFWINSGVLIYFSFNIFLFMLFNQISKPNFYMIHSVTNTIANLLFAIGLFCKPQKIV
jgi:hypothetical protein